MSTNSRRTLAAAFSAAVASFLVIQTLAWLLPETAATWNARVIDRLFEIRGTSTRYRPSYDSTVVHLDITDNTIRQLRHAYLRRAQFARVVRNLHAMETAAQAWDFILPGRLDDEGDSLLVDAVRRAGSVYFGLAFELYPHPVEHADEPDDAVYLQNKRWTVREEGGDGLRHAGRSLLSYAELAEAVRGLGFLNVAFDPDGVFRRAPLLVRWRDGFVPSLPFAVACDYLRVSPDSIVVSPGESITLRSARFPDGRIQDVHIPIDWHGNMIVNFIGPWERMKHYDFADILRASDDRMDMEDWADELRGRIIVVSQVTTGSADVGPVPTDNNFPLSGIHANVIHTILTGSFLREASALSRVAVEVFLLLVFVFLARHRSSWLFLAGVATLILLFAGLVAWLFLARGILLASVQPVGMLGLGAVTVLLYRFINEEKEKEVLRRSFEQYFPPSVARRIMANPSSITKGGQKKELTILFSDIRSFTTHSATMQPDEIQRMLNEYFEAMVDIVFEHEGTVDKFIGDGLMVFFGDPEPQQDHALRCVRAAVAMQRKARELRRRWEAEGGVPLEIRIGINTGPVVVGNMGSSRRLSYTVLGADVNLTQRLEANAPPGGILISRRTCDLVKDRIAVREGRTIRVKGLETPVEVFEVVVDER